LRFRRRKKPAMVAERKMRITLSGHIFPHRWASGIKQELPLWLACCGAARMGEGTRDM
jgi:hypothetical protein